MLGGEHLRERFSERAQHLQNQPKHRGYLPGTHLRTGDGGGYGAKTLQGNWVEERRDASYYDGKSALPTDLDRTWQSTYAQQSQTSARPPTTTFNQTTLIEVVDGSHRAFPGHQVQLDPAREQIQREAFLSTTQFVYKNPAVTRAQHEEHVPPVKGGVPGAQGKAVTLRIRHRLLQSGQQNLIANFRRRLIDADTSKSGFINANELQRGCQNCGVALDDVETRVMIKSLDKVGNALAAVDDIVNNVRGEFTERRASLAEKAFSLLLKVNGGVVRFGRLCELYDAAQHPEVKSGAKSVQSMESYLRQQFDVASPDDVVERSEFIRCYADYSFEIPSDLIFETMVRNTWHLSGGEGKCENTSCRRVQVVHTNGRVTREEIKDDLGIGEDVERIRQNLVAQGIHDIAKIEFLASS